MVEINHNWVRKETGWFINCKKQNKEFSLIAWQKGNVQRGICPFCGANAEAELEALKKEMEELNAKKHKKEDLKKRNTLGAYL